MFSDEQKIPSRQKPKIIIKLKRKESVETMAEYQWPLTDVFHKWTDKSTGIPFKCRVNGVGNGEKKLAAELGITIPPGGQNTTYDLNHSHMGYISVKDMSNDSCTLGTEGATDMRKVFSKIVYPFVSWIEKFKSSCNLANMFYTVINKSYGSSKTTILDGIYRFELSESNLKELNEILNKLKKHIESAEPQLDSLKSEYITDIFGNLSGKNLQDMLNTCVQEEAKRMTLIIVSKEKGWLIVRDVNRLACPRITRGAPRISYN